MNNKQEKERIDKAVKYWQKVRSEKRAEKRKKR